MWSQQTQYTIRLSFDEITHKSFHLIPSKWNHGSAMIVQIINNDPQITQSKRNVYERWFYDCGRNSSSIALMTSWLHALASGEVKGVTAEHLVHLIFRHIIDNFPETRTEFIKHFPETAKEMTIQTPSTQ